MKQELAEFSLEERYAYYQEQIQELTMMSDTFMRTVLLEKKCTEAILRIILEKPALTVISQTIQKDFKNLQGRSAILDCTAQDNEGRVINIEVQQDQTEASPRRARYHSPVLADRVRELKETKGGIKTMCEVMDRIYNWGEQIGERRGIQLGEERGEKRGEKRGEERSQRETSLNLFKMGMPVDQIALAVNASPSIIRKWLSQE